MEDVLYDSFFCCSRSDVENCQLLNKNLLKAIVKGTNELPLRRIDRVEMDCYRARGEIQIFLKKVENGQDVDELPADYKASIHDGDNFKTFRLLQPACIRRFSVGIHGSRLLDYLKAERSANFTVLSIDISLANDPDYDYMDPIVNLLKPMAMEVVRQRAGSGNSHNSDRLKLLERDAFLNNLQTIRVVVWFGNFPPTSFVLDEPGYANYEVKCCYGRKAPDAIDELLNDFTSRGCTNRKLQSLCVRWDDIYDQQSSVPKLLSSPTPANRFVVLDTIINQVFIKEIKGTTAISIEHKELRAPVVGKMLISIAVEVDKCPVSGRPEGAPAASVS